MAMFVEVWQSGIFYFHWMIFFHWFILKPFFANIFDCMLFGGVSWGFRKALMTIWYHVIPFGAFVIYDFCTVSQVANTTTSNIDNLDEIVFQDEYQNWNFYYTLIALFPGAISGALACVLSKYWIIKNEGYKMRARE